MSAPARSFVITQHAMRRYVERIREGADMREAFLVLRDASGRARRDGERTWRGQALWTVDVPPMRLVTRHDPLVGTVLVTVLEPEAPLEQEHHAPAEEELATPLRTKAEGAERHAALVAERQAAERKRERRALHAANRERNAALGMPTNSEKKAAYLALAAVYGPVCAHGCGTFIGDYASAWRRHDDGAGVCPSCDVALDLDHHTISTARAVTTS